MSFMTADKASWHYLTPEIRLLVLEVLLRDSDGGGYSLASCAAVSREWQAVIEPHNFTRIKLTPSRLANFGSMVYRNRV